MLVGPLQLPDEAFLHFAERVQPELVVIGAFGAPQWAAVERPREWLEKWRAVFERLHRRGIRVVGTFELLNVGNTPQEAGQFVEFFTKRWDAELLGPRPPVAGASLLEQRTMPAERQVREHAPRGCPANPHWRTVAKALVKPLVQAGLDGFITHRNMFGECGCPFCHAELPKEKPAAHGRHHASDPPPCDYCSQGFRRWLADRYDADRLRTEFGIRDLRTHRLVAIDGHHREHERLPTPLQLEGMKFARHAIKECFDDVFVHFARGLKPDLLLAQWNHMPYFDELHRDRSHIPEWHVTTFAHVSADERWSLPSDLWGRGEDFFWYCNWGTCQNTELEKRFVADVTLYAKLLRSQSRGRPYVINKYDFYRPRNMLAEAAGLGMIVGAKDVPYQSSDDARVAGRYFDFLRRHAGLYDRNNGEPVSDALLVYPRTASQAGDVSGVEMVEAVGRSLIVDHVQFDLVPDDLLAAVPLDRYRALIATTSHGLDGPRVRRFVEAGGQVLAVPGSATHAADPAWEAWRAQVIRDMPIHSGGTPQAAELLAALNRVVAPRRLRVDAPYTVEAHLYRQGPRFVLHLVNYDHRERATGRSVVEREAPLAVESVGVELALPENARAKVVRFFDPDADGSRDVAFQRDGPRVRFKAPSFLVYGVCVVELEP